MRFVIEGENRLKSWTLGKLLQKRDPTNVLTIYVCPNRIYCDCVLLDATVKVVLFVPASSLFLEMVTVVILVAGGCFPAVLGPSVVCEIW